MIKDMRRKVLKGIKTFTKTADDVVTQSLANDENRVYDKCNVHFVKEYKHIRIIHVVRFTKQGDVAVLNDDKDVTITLTKKSGKMSTLYKGECVFKNIKAMELYLAEYLGISNINYYNLSPCEDVYFTKTSLGVFGDVAVYNNREFASCSILNILLSYGLIYDVEFISSNVSYLSYNPVRTDMKELVDGDISREYVQERINKGLCCAFVSFTKQTRFLKYNEEFDTYQSMECSMMDDIKALCSRDGLKIVNASNLGFFVMFK